LKPKTVGVLGGMGPEATVDFMIKVIAATPAVNDQQHIPMLIDHNPALPNRHDAIAGRSPGIGPQLADMARRLELAGADFLVMVCNSAHAYTEDIRAAVTIPFVSMIDVTVEALPEYSARRVGVMAAEGCLQAGLYQTRLEQTGYEPVLWSAPELEKFMTLVYRVKAGERDPEIGEQLAALAASLAFDGADTLIAGCTEIPLFLSSRNCSLPLLSSTDLLVKRTVELASF
jgi:aspartate racemase